MYNETVFDNKIDARRYITPAGYKTCTKIQNITFRDIKGSYAFYAGQLSCSNDPPCTGLVFENINLVTDGSSSTTWQCSDNVYGTVKNVKPAVNCLS